MAVTQQQAPAAGRQRRRTVTANGVTKWRMQAAGGAQRTVALKCQTAGELLAENIPPRRWLSGALAA